MVTFTKKENIPNGKPKAKGKPKANTFANGPAHGTFNPYDLLEGKNGNPTNAQEFEESAHEEGELFFVLDPDFEGTQDELKAAKNRVLILNYIFYKLHQSMPRSVPSDLATSKQTEIFHREVYMGVSLDVGVHFYWANEIATAQAFVAVTGVDFDSADYKGAVFGIHASNADESKEDQATEMVKELSKFYWTPRWKYVVEYLRKRMYAYSKFGDIVPELDNPRGPGPDENDKTEREEIMSIYQGSSGAIIGPKGSKISELKSLSGVQDIYLPKKDEFASKGRARDLIDITITGTAFTIQKARVLIQAVVDEWANAPRASRGEANGESGSNGGGGWGNNGGAEWGVDSGGNGTDNTLPVANNGWEVSAAVPADKNSWADDVNAEVAAKEPLDGSEW